MVPPSAGGTSTTPWWPPHPRHDALRSDLDRVLRQRNALLRQSGGRLTDEIELTLDVWDAKLIDVGEALAAAREALIARLAPVLASAYEHVAAPAAEEIGASYEATWRSVGLGGGVAGCPSGRAAPGVSLVGPHRDDLALTIGGLPARTHASQGEQRSLALALRLAAHHVVTDATGSAPVLLLDDVFSELDPAGRAALLEHLPAGQTLLSSAAGLPPGAHPEVVLRVAGGRVSR